VWYDPCMETIAEGAIRPEQAVGKPLVVYVNGERRVIGEITHAAIRDGKLYVASTINLDGEVPLS
jgi:hypothetical protein